MTRKFGRMCSDNRGISGLETAIVLIAFVVVAAVFAYTALSAGLFSTQKAQEAVYSGLKQTQSTMDVRGGVIAYSNGSSYGHVVRVDVTVAITSGGEPINLKSPHVVTGAVGSETVGANPDGKGPVMITFSSSDTKVSEVAWTVDWVGCNNADYMLEEGEKAVISVWFHPLTTGNYGAGTNPPYLGSDTVGTFDTFRLEIKPTQGAVLVVERTTPHIMSPVMDLR